MALHTAFASTLGIKHPILQAPLAGADSAALAIAVSKAGGLGAIAGAYRTPAQIRDVAAEVRAATDAPFSLNLFAPQPARPEPDNMDAARARVAGYYLELGEPVPGDLEEAGFQFEGQLAAVLETGAKLVSFTFGIPPREAADAIKARGILLAGTATSVGEAKALAASGVDAIIAQGSEAGGHRGSFPDVQGGHAIGTMALVPQIASAVDVPVIAAGGIMDGRGIAAAVALGASAAQLGTAFLACPEAGIADVYRQAILEADADDTRITRAFSGRAARGIVNRFMREVDAAGDILPFPLQNALTRSLRKAAGAADRPEFLSLWAGQGLGLARPCSAGELMEDLIAGTEEAAKRLRS